MGKVETVIEMAQQLAAATDRFFDLKGPGVGDKATGAFMMQLGAGVCAVIGEDCSETRICGDNNLAVDFFFPDEQTIVEVALSLRNPGSEFERDILKALMAQGCEHPVKRLVFVAKPRGSASPQSAKHEGNRRVGQSTARLVRGNQRASEESRPNTALTYLGVTHYSRSTAPSLRISASSLLQEYRDCRLTTLRDQSSRAGADSRCP